MLACLFQDKLYLHNKSFVSLVGCEENGYIIRVVTMKSVKNPLVEDDRLKDFNHYDEKMEESILRARRTIFEIAMCNPWDYFFTGTLNQEKYDRYDLDKFHKDLTQFFRDKARAKIYNGNKINFLLIPERHKNGAWHMHGLLSGVPVEVLHQFQIGDKMSSDIAELIKKGEIIYNWEDYQNKFGFCTLGKIKSRQAVNRYITKYITKDVLSSVKELNSQMYYRSRDLSLPMKIKEGFMSANIKPSFESDYCTVTELPYSAESIKMILDSFI